MSDLQRSILLGTILHASLVLPLKADSVIVEIKDPMSPPTWALLQRQLLAANSKACEEFFSRYFDDRGYLLCVE